MKKVYIGVKRIIDFLLSLILLIILSPIMLIVAIAVKLDSKGPAFLKQERSGKNNKLFIMYKFRSMVADNDVHDLKTSDRVTRVGKFIRKTSLDEIPQLINILKGEMSFIGPRPWIVEYSNYFTSKQMRRLEVLPGMTGLAQCEGRNGISIFDKINYDIKYVENISLKMDLYIIFKSIYTVFSGKDAAGDKNIIKNELEDLKNQFNGEFEIKETKKDKMQQKKIAKDINNKEELGEDVYAESVI